MSDSKTAEDVLLEKKIATGGDCNVKVISRGTIGNITVQANGRRSEHDSLRYFGMEGFDVISEKLDLEEHDPIRRYVDGEDYDPQKFDNIKNEVIRKYGTFDKENQRAIWESVEIFLTHSIAINVINNANSVWTIIFNPYGTEDVESVLDNCSCGSIVSLDRTDGQSYVEIDGTEIEAEIYTEDVSINDLPNEGLVSDIHRGYNRSDYEGWLRVDLTEDSPNMESDKFRLSLKGWEDEWIFEEPAFWDKKHDIVNLIEEFGTGDPNQLDSVLIRPRFASLSLESSIPLAISENREWVMALEKPSQVPSESDSIIARLASALGIS